MNIINFFSVMSSWLMLAVFIAFIAMFISFIQVFKKTFTDKKINLGRLKTLIFLAVFIILYLVLSSSMSSSVMKAAGYAFEEEDVRVSINNVFLSQEQQGIFIQNFLSFNKFKRSGSHPTVTYKVKVLSKNYNLDFDLKEDSRDEGVYWLYYHDYRFKGKLGMVRTEIINEMNL